MKKPQFPKKQAMKHRFHYNNDLNFTDHNYDYEYLNTLICGFMDIIIKIYKLIKGNMSWTGNLGFNCTLDTDETE